MPITLKAPVVIWFHDDAVTAIELENDCLLYPSWVEFTLEGKKTIYPLSGIFAIDSTK